MYLVCSGYGQDDNTGAGHGQSWGNQRRTNFQRAARTPTAPIGVPSKTSTQPSGTAWSTNIGERPDAAPNATAMLARKGQEGDLSNLEGN